MSKSMKYRFKRVLCMVTVAAMLAASLAMPEMTVFASEITTKELSEEKALLTADTETENKDQNVAEDSSLTNTDDSAESIG